MSLSDFTAGDFRVLLSQISELAVAYLGDMDSRAIQPTMSGLKVVGALQSALPEKGLGLAALQDLDTVIDNSRAQNGRFFGYVLGSGEPVAAAADLLASVLNQNVTAWRSGPAAATVERTVVQWLAEAIGCQEFSGSLTGGGSSANLMGLAMAREAILPANENGVSAQGTVYASEQVHMSIGKSVALLGLGRHNLRLVPTDAEFRMIPAELDAAMARDRSTGKRPLAVVASAGTVNTGAIDPLVEIAEIVRRHKAWLHIDGAYGALAAIAQPEKFRGLDQADSISLDPHKWLYQPLDCGCLLYRNPAAAQVAFSHTGDYARALTSDPIEGFAFFEESLELSRRFRALKLWLSLRYHGLAAFREAIEKDLRLARRLADAIRNHPHLELEAPVELSAVCFRYRGPAQRSAEAENRHNEAILRRVNHRGKVYLSNATLHGRFCLRACLVNHRTTQADIDAVIPEVIAAAAKVE